MPEYLAPGVYIEEVQSGPPPIVGVSTSTSGFVGVARRGPVEGRPRLVTGYGEFVRTFGGALDLGATFAGQQDLPYAVRGFFSNGGRRAYVMRVAPATATVATGTLSGGLVTRLVGDVAANATVLRLPTLRGIHSDAVPANQTQVQLVMVRDGLTTTSAVLTVTAIDRVNSTVTLSAAPSATTTFEARSTTVFTNAGDVAAGGTIADLATPATARPSTLALTATSPGSWGRLVKVAPTHRSTARSIVQHTLMTTATNTIPLISTAGFYPNAWVEVDFGNGATDKVYRQVTSVIGTTVVIAGAPVPLNGWDPIAPVTETRIASCEFDLSLTYEDPVERTVISERFEGLTLEDVPGRHYLTQLLRSQLVNADPAVVPAATHPLLFPSAADGLSDTLGTAGSDGTSAVSDIEFQGTDLGPNRKTGILALEEVDEISIIAAPGITSSLVQRTLLEQCERLLDRFAIFDPVPGTSGAPATMDDIQRQGELYDTKYAALYYPRVVMTDVATGAPLVVAPSGHIAGIFARTDATRGVHKAPANEVISGVVDLETFVSKAQQEILNPRKINVLRDIRADRRGLRVYGARCLTSDDSWRYVNIRRLFLFLEESIDEGTQWAVFEPNDTRLWARVRDSVSIFLTGVWRDGALMGDKPEDAFFVVCDRNTMSDDDILNGRLVLEIGIAPVRPAEFVIIRIGQWLGGSTRQEL